MANLPDDSGNAASNIVQGQGTGSLSFPMPRNLPLDVESVVATIDNTAGAATTATLVVRDSSGEVVATKRMEDTFPAGDTGTVTFSLRNAASGTGTIRFVKDPQSGGWLYVETTGTNPATGNAFDIVATGVVNVQTTGAYFVTASNTQQTVAGDYQIQAAQSGSGELQLESADDANLTAAATLTVEGVGGSLVFDGFGVTAKFVAGTTFAVLGPTNQTLFEVGADGILHGQTGKALVFDR